jgi:transposase
VDTFRRGRILQEVQVSRSRRTFSEEFKREAIRLVVDGKRSITGVAKELGLYQSTLGRWVKQAGIDAGRGPAGALTTDEREELGRLRREIRTLREEREFLKKATAFFAKENR